MANSTTTSPLPAVASPTAQVSATQGNYQVVVKAPAAGGMLAYLVGPGAEIVLQGINLNTASLTQEAGNLRISLPNKSEILLIDYVNSAADSATTVTTAEGRLPAQKLLAALGASEADQAALNKLAEIEPAAGQTTGNGSESGGLIPPTILGTGVGSGQGIFSSVIDPFALGRPTDQIFTELPPFFGNAGGQPPVTPPANLPPFARNDSFSTAINKALTLQPGQLLVNDTDPENNPLTIVSVQGAENGTVSIVNGNVVFTPAAGFTGTGSFSYTISDGNGGTSTADVIIQIDPVFVNQNTVIAADDAVTVPEAGRSIVANVLANDSDPEGDALVPGSVRILTGPGVGTATVNPNGTINYQSVPSNTGYFTTLVYEVSDARGARDTATLTIEVKANINNVDAIDDTGEIIPAGASKVFNVTNNDIDPQGDAFSITRIVTGPAQGTASFNAATGTITYNSVPSLAGYTETIVYEITDARGAKDTATLTVRVEPVNNVSAVDDTADLKAGESVNIRVLQNDFDGQNDSFSITRIVEQPRNDAGTLRGSVTINPNGTITFTDTPGARDSDILEFKYEIEDARGAKDTAVVRVTIGAAANGVDANNDTLDVNENSPRADITSRLLANDFDPQNDAFSITGLGTIPASQGTLELVGGRVFFTPANNYDGPVTFTYTITDSKGATDTAQVTISVLEVLDGLNAGDDTFTTPFNTNLNITAAQLLSNDNDPDGSVLNSNSIISFTQPANGVLTRDANGNFVFNPNDTFRGTTTFTYTIRDGQGETDTATVTIRVADPEPQDNPVNAVDDTVILAPGETRSVNVLTNDSAPDGGLQFVRLVDPLPAGVTQVSPGVFSYAAPANVTGQNISFRYEVRDTDGDTDIATVTFQVRGPVNSVDAVDDTATLIRSAANNAVDAITINVKANDTDPNGDAFSVTRIVSGPAIGSAVLNPDGTITYTADAGNRSNYTTTLVYEVTDARGAKDTATVTINVGDDFNNVDARDDVATMAKDVNSILIDAKANDVDPQGDAFSITNIVSVSSGTATIENGQIRYTNPTRDAGTATIVYEVTDAKGAKDTATITVNIEADTNNVDARDDVATMAKDVNSILIDAKANDVDPQGDVFSITNIVSVSSGTATIENGQIRYTNPTRDAGTATIVYEVTDAKGAKDTATITVNIEADTNNVDARDDVATMAKDVNTILIDAKANDVDPQGDAFSITNIVSVSSGTATIENGQIRYTNPTRDAGTATIVYEVTDAKGAKDTATITVNIAADSNTVDAIDDYVTVPRNSTSSFSAIANDTDPQGDSFTFTRIVSGPSIGSATANANGIITYVSAGGFGAGYTTSLVYEITDSKGAKDTATVFITVQPNFAPPPPPPSNNGGGGGNGRGSDCPLTIDLTGNGIQITMQAGSQAYFDLDGNGTAEWTSWVTGADDALLAFDRNGNGTIDGIHEVFGGNGIDGFTELARLEDTNHDGVVDANDAHFAQLQLWLDANHNGVSEAGELHSLSSFNISSINVAQTQDASIQYGDAFINKLGTVNLTDGSTLQAASVFYTNTSGGVVNGSTGNDILVYSAEAKAMFGNGGTDTMLVQAPATITIGTDALQVQGVQTINLHNAGSDKLNLNAADILTIGNHGILTVQGDAVDEVRVAGDLTQGANVQQGNTTYASYTAANGGQLLVELGVTVQPEHLHHG